MMAQGRVSENNDSETCTDEHDDDDDDEPIEICGDINWNDREQEAVSENRAQESDALNGSRSHLLKYKDKPYNQYSIDDKLQYDLDSRVKVSWRKRPQLAVSHRLILRARKCLPPRKMQHICPWENNPASSCNIQLIATDRS